MALLAGKSVTYSYGSNAFVTIATLLPTGTEHAAGRVSDRYGVSQVISAAFHRHGPFRAVM